MVNGIIIQITRIVLIKWIRVKLYDLRELFNLVIVSQYCIL